MDPCTASNFTPGIIAGVTGVLLAEALILGLVFTAMAYSVIKALRPPRRHDADCDLTSLGQDQGLN